MPKISRNICSDKNWIIKKVENHEICKAFDCGDDDLDEYFQILAVLHKKELLTETYCLQKRTVPDLAVGLLDFCNDTVHLRDFEDEVDIDPAKQHYNYLPAVKLTRFGIAKDFQSMNIGSHVLNMIKDFFITDNRTGCRFITVDAYNTPRVIKFYKKNGFNFFWSRDRSKRTRTMYYDLKRRKAFIELTLQ